MARSVEAAVPGGKSTVAAVYDRRSLISTLIKRRYNSARDINFFG